MTTRHFRLAVDEKGRGALYDLDNSSTTPVPNVAGVTVICHGQTATRLIVELIDVAIEVDARVVEIEEKRTTRFGELGS